MSFAKFAFSTLVLGSSLLAAACGGGGGTGGGGAGGGTTTATGNTAASTGGATSTGATASSTGATTSSTGATTSSTTGAGGAPDCSAFFATPGPCGLCTEQKCCSELTACKGSQDCLDCMMGVKDVKTDPACKAAPTKALLDAVDTCDNTQCTNACLNPDMDTAACDAKTTQVGACATDTAKFPCNPITNAGCKAGEQCDYAIGMGADDTFVCFPLDPMPTSVCEDCSMHFCGAGLTCIGTCARYCCDNTDCGTGICSKTTAQVDKPGMGAVGICVAKP